MSVSLPLVSVVVPTYRSTDFVALLVERLLAVFEARGQPCEIILVNDASPDRTWDTLVGLNARHPGRVRIVNLMKNSGQHNAILCGLKHVRGEVVVTMDDDLQHPPDQIPLLLDKLAEGYDLVIGAYEEKRHAGWRNLAGGLVDRVLRMIYRLPPTMQLTSFRAIRRSLVDVAKQSRNAYPYITCILFDQASRVTNVTVRHDARVSGASSYSMARSVMLATNILFSYSSVPLYVTATFCALASLVSSLLLLWVLLVTLTRETGVPGWASVMVLLSVFSTLIYISLFIMGVYVARVHHQLSGRRVPYTVDELRD
jgi:glycosyltransferase involved in cell wall biosynthesis